MVNPACPTRVQNAFAQIIAKSQSASGRAEITQKYEFLGSVCRLPHARLGLCTPLAAGAAPLRLLNLWIENAFATLGMEDYPYPLYGFPAFPMNAACSIMMSYDDNLYAFYFDMFFSRLGLAWVRRLAWRIIPRSARLAASISPLNTIHALISPVF